MKVKNKFISSNFKFLTSLVLIITLLVSAIIAFAIYFMKNNYIFLIIASIAIMFIVISCILLDKLVYVVYVCNDKFKFYSCIIRKQFDLSFIDVLNVYEFTVVREGTIYILEKLGEGNILKINYPYKFDKTKTTENLIKNVLNLEVKNVVK